MNWFRIHRAVEFFTGMNLAMGVLWLGLFAFTIGLLVLRYSRWGQTHQLQKCMALSVLAHILLLGYAATMHIMGPGPGGGESVCFIALSEDSDSENGELGGNRPGDGDEKNSAKEQWQLQADAPPQLKTPELLPAPRDLAQDSKRLLEELQTKLSQLTLGQTLDKIIAPQPKPVDANARIGELVPIDSSDLIENASQSNRTESGDIKNKTLQIVSQSKTVASMEGTITDGSDGRRGGNGGGSFPDLYKLRVMPNRSGIAQRHGATPESEKAVQLALHWLANNQTDDGRWDPNEHGGGRETNVQGRNRQNAGNKADTGITGLALLAFLAGGHTHQQGPYSENMRRGLEYLLQSQAADGNLGGKAQVYEFMYCQAMAAFALSEAYGMTHDPRLETPVRRAIGYTIAAQDPRGGGWRYRPADPGDTSQLGWQLMALKSAELAGIPMPQSTRNGIKRFLQSVSSGNQSGLASYRPGERASRPMTAEALVCWQFLGIAREHPACNEAGNFLLEELPGSGIANDYYWYYATIAMYQLQGDYWQRWNEALQATLLSRQVRQGPLTGSWNTDTLWGSYGGRVYTTAIATLALEVYYRFLPLYAETGYSKQP